MQPVRRALISVSDKTGVVELARGLVALGVEILSTGGTSRLLTDHDLPVTEVADYTGFPEMMGGRVKTLHPRIHGGILGRRGVDDRVMHENEIKPIDLVVVNLYPFEETVAKPGCDLATAIENIDIGGPTLLRAAAKNYAGVTVLVDAADYPRVIEELAQTGGVADIVRFDLAVKAFEHTAAYDGAIANYLGTVIEHPEHQAAGLPRTFNLQFQKRQAMRYGENPHQGAAFYVARNLIESSVATARQLQGKELSYNNIADTDAAIECVKQFDEAPACVIVKHANPCGVAVGASLLEAYERAYSTDPESAFGGIIAFNRELDGETARVICERQFVEVIVAPRVSAAASAAVAAKKNVRLLECGDWTAEAFPRLDFKRVSGGLLVQDADLRLTDSLRTVTKREPSTEEMGDLLFTWRVAKYVKSNAIVYGREGMTIGVGAGQMSRVNSARIAGIKAEQAGLKVAGSVMASDAFFPFRDGIDQAAAAGITAVIQPGRLDARRRGHRRRRRARPGHGLHRHAALPALSIHPSAIVEDGAQVHDTASVGPYSIIEAGAVIGADCRIESCVRIFAPTRMGVGNRVCHGATLGSDAQDLGFDPARARPLVIGDHNLFKEGVNISCGTKSEAGTRIGSHNYWMAYSHAGHDCVVGDHNIFANTATLAGHVEVGDRCFLSGQVAVHQFCRIGSYAMVAGVTGVPQDVPPFALADGHRARLVGLNVVGLRRGGFTQAQRSRIKAVYRLVFRSGLRLARGPGAGRVRVSRPRDPADRPVHPGQPARRADLPSPERHADRE